MEQIKETRIVQKDRISIPVDVLNIQIGETYDGPYTLKDELVNLKGEQLKYVDYTLEDTVHGTKSLRSFLCYTNSYVAILVHTIFGDLSLVVLERNPPEKS